MQGLDRATREVYANLKRQETWSWSKLTAIVNRDQCTNYSKQQVRDMIRVVQPKKERPTLVFGDTHEPFTHPRYLEFLQDVYKQYKCKEVICTGDLVDNHAISRHQTEPDAIGALDEYNQVVEGLKKYVEAFPKLKMCIGNHDNIGARQLATIGMPSIYLKNMHELWGLPETWEIKNAFVIDKVLYKHGINCSGKDGALNTAIQERMSTCIGHMHSFGGCKYIANHRDIIFGMNVGCGIDIEAYAFAYGRDAKYRPTLGCGIVYNNQYAVFVPMPMDKYGRSK